MRVFKLGHDELAALLPEAAFKTLDTALPVVCKAMCNDEEFDESDVRPGLERALRQGGLKKPPVLVLKDIRQSALDFLKDYEEATSSNNNNSEDILCGLRPLDCPPPPSASPSNGDYNLFETRTREVTAKQALGILANAFFANCFDTMKSHKDIWNCGGLDWRGLLQDRFVTVGVERMRCHLLYFEATSSDDNKYDLDDRRIVFERIRYTPIDFLDGETVVTNERHYPKPSLPVGHGIVLHDDVMERPTRPCSAFVNFANANFGYGKFIRSCTQEEILLSCCPEIMVGMLFIGKMGEDEVVNVSNVRRYAKYSGYLDTFKCLGPIDDDVVVLQDILTIDACYDLHFSNKNILRDLNKSYASFRAHAETTQHRRRRGGRPSSTRCIISTGKWGCGAFGGVSAHKFVQQVLAAHVAGVDLEFSAFGDPESCDVVLNTLKESKPAALHVVKALRCCKNGDSFVKDFQDVLRSEVQPPSATNDTTPKEPSAAAPFDDNV